MSRPDPGLMKGWPPIFRSAYLSRASLAIRAPRWSACPELSFIDMAQAPSRRHLS